MAERGKYEFSHVTSKGPMVADTYSIAQPREGEDEINAKKCYLLAIPTELRFSIYDCYFQDCRSNQRGSALVQTCKQVRIEGLAEFESIYGGLDWLFCARSITKHSSAA